MSTTAWNSSVAALKQLPSLANAVQAGSKLIALWPLHDHVHIDNDVKYAEEFQVRTTRQMALVLTGETVTVPDAEFVYEGADEIPGRPQNIVDALLAANDAYDETADFSEDSDPSHITEAARLLGDVWNEATVEAMNELMSEASKRGGELTNEDLLSRYALSAAVFADALATVTEHAENEDAARHAALVTVLYFNEFDEWLGVPRVFISAEDLETFRALAVAGPENGNAEKLVDKLDELARAEWTKHHDDVLWDPAEAKKKAKEEDEKRNKEALAAKFAHVKDDPKKPHVEL